MPYNGTSNAALAEPIPWRTNTLTDIQSFLVPGTNVMAVQAFNSSMGSSSDFIINPALYYTPDLTAPTVTLLYPAAGGSVRQLTSIEVGFDEPVAGVDAADLLVNGAAGHRPHGRHALTVRFQLSAARPPARCRWPGRPAMASPT